MYLKSLLVERLEKFKVYGDINLRVKRISSDSRNIKKGDLFVAIKGLTHDGHKFIPQVIKKGACAVVGEISPQKTWLKNITYIKVEDSKKALGIIASTFYGNPSKKLKVIGVTGTKGKTTTVHLIAHILNSCGKKAGLISTVSYKGLHVTTPESLEIHKILAQMVKKGLKYAVIEISSHGIDQKRIAGIEFDTTVLTNIAPEHLDYHKTFDSYKRTKMSFIKMGKNKVICPKKTKINILPGRFNNLNAEAAVQAVSFYGIDREKALATLSTFSLPEGRLQKVKNKKGLNIYVDFAHTPDSLRAVLKFLRRKTHGKLICVFGCAGERDKNKREIMGAVSCKFADISVFTAEDPRSENVLEIIKQIERGAVKVGAKKLDIKDFLEANRSRLLQILKNRQKVFFSVPDRGMAITFAISNLVKKNDTIVICGKGHEKSMNYDGKEFSWSDIEAIKYALRGRVKKLGPVLLA